MTTEAEAIAQLQKNASQLPHIVEVLDGEHAAQVLMVPGQNGSFTPHHVKPFTEPYRKQPERRRGTAFFTDLVSFITHAKRFADVDSVVFADKTPTAPKLTAVLDYHRAGATGDPRFGTHRSVYTFPLSDEWQAWASQDGHVMGQAEFAGFIEENLADVADPGSALDGAKKFAALMSCVYASASSLLELSRGLTVHVGSKVAQHVSLQSGTGKITFETKHTDEAGAPISVPGAFIIQIPAFKEGPLYQIPARLRYRTSGGNISWSYDLYRASAVLDHAIGEGCDTVAEDTKLPVLSGSPES